MAPILNIKPAPSTKGTTRKNERFWVVDIHTNNGELFKVCGGRHQPSPKWWPAAEPKPVKATPSSLGGRRAARKHNGTTPFLYASPSSTPTKTKRKASDGADTCRQPAPKRARTAPLPAPKPCAKPVHGSSSNIRTRSQTKVVIPSEQVPLAANTVPLPPSYSVPRELQHVVPAFGACGSHRCGHHVRPYRARKHLTCRDCAQKLPYGAMHVLNCGHALCRACLNNCAAATKALLNDRDVWRQVQVFRDEHEYEVVYGSSSGSTSSSTVAPEAAGVLATPSPVALSPSPHGTAPPIMMTEAFAGALKLLNLTCCGMDTGISAFQDCMDPDNAAANWLVDQLLVDPECYPVDELEACTGDAYNRCAWRDCQSLLPSVCRFEQRRYTYFYCVQCSGVSFSLAHGVNRPSRS